jgi:type VI secretion system protein VasG
VHEIFFQVFDKGQMEDGSGRLINFRNSIILLTTNVGDKVIEQRCADKDGYLVEENFPPACDLEAAIRPAMASVFPAALLGRIQIVAYYPLGEKALYNIIEAKLQKIKHRVAENYNGAELVVADAVTDEIIRRCDNAASGARLIDAIVNNSILPELSAEFLRTLMAEKTFAKAMVDVKDEEFVYAFE